MELYLIGAKALQSPDKGPLSSLLNREKRVCRNDALAEDFHLTPTLLSYQVFHLHAAATLNKCSW